ncbi:unnamed protein product [Closterium sp. Naga37s-1]|nr:unnamed protein product [Closterium sp. Naga37s-1]
MLLVKENVAVSLQDLTAAITCFPNLSHLHLSDNSVETISDAFLDFLASACPKLVSLHVGREITLTAEYEPEEMNLVTEAGLDRFLRRCTQLQHLSLYCLHCYCKLPDSLSLLTNLHTLALTEASPLEAPGFTRLTSLTALSVDMIPQPEGLKFASLTHLPAFTTLALFNYAWLKLEVAGSQPFSFAQLPWLKAVEFDAFSPRFESMFPSGVSFSRLERLLLKGSSVSVVARLPDDIGQRLPRLRHLSLWGWNNVPELPEQFASLSCLRDLTIFSCDIVSLPENFGELPALKALTLNSLPITSLPDSFYQLTSLETLHLSYCNAIFELPARFGFLTALNSLCILNSPNLKLPDDIGSLTNLHTFRLRENSPQQLLPSSFTQLASLTWLELTQCMLEELPEDLGKLRNLRDLTVQSCSKIQQLPDSLTDLVNLNVLKAIDFDSLTAIPTSLSNLRRLKELVLAKRLTPLLELPSLPRLRRMSLTCVGHMRELAQGMTLPSLEHLELTLAGEAEDLPLPLELLTNLCSLTLHSTGCMEKLPEGFGSALRQLRRLQIEGAAELVELSDSFTDLQSLTSVEIHAPKLAFLPHGMGALSRLHQLNLDKCSSLTHLPASLTQLSYLHALNLRRTRIRSLPSNFGQLSRLKGLNLDGCRQLASLPEDLSQLKMLLSLTHECCDELEAQFEAQAMERMYGLSAYHS